MSWLTLSLFCERVSLRSSVQCWICFIITEPVQRSDENAQALPNLTKFRTAPRVTFLKSRSDQCLPPTPHRPQRAESPNPSWFVSPGLFPFAPSLWLSDAQPPPATTPSLCGASLSRSQPKSNNYREITSPSRTSFKAERTLSPPWT